MCEPASPASAKRRSAGRVLHPAPSDIPALNFSTSGTLRIYARFVAVLACIAIAPLEASSSGEEPVASRLVRVLIAEASRLSIGEGDVQHSVDGSWTLPREFHESENGSLVRVSGKPYRGLVQVERAGGNKIRAVNVLPLEDYLRGVVPREAPPGWPLEALKAQAVAARSYALAIVAAKNGSGAWDLNSTVSDQVYGGASAETMPTDRAVFETSGEILLFRGESFPAWFSSNCGGHGALASENWGANFSGGKWGELDERVLRAQPDSWCLATPAYSWRLPVDARAAARLLRPLADFSRVDSISTLGRTGSGRVKAVRITGRNRKGKKTELSVSAHRFRMSWGPNRIRSLRFDVRKTKGGFEFEGTGWGHGVGLCQWGARGMAAAGADYRAILARYYGAATVSAELADANLFTSPDLFSSSSPEAPEVTFPSEE